MFVVGVDQFDTVSQWRAGWGVCTHGLVAHRAF